ncbi:hypothetical protein AAHA92_34002 [Salvia divinorum]|uniref:Integrase zinc-binding domain-containing protein n=1 Tax=Salvia divinorum TaxID=28513 RepID=A0ABD1FKP2_SALDI
MDDFTIYGDLFEACLHHLDKVLERCRAKNLVLNFEKCHFMVTEGIVLGHIVSEKGIQVDPAKLDVIAKLPYPTNQKEFRGFLGHAGEISHSSNHPLARLESAFRNHVIVYTDHTAIKYLLAKRESKPRLIRWGEEEESIPDVFPEDHLFSTMHSKLTNWTHQLAQLDPAEMSAGMTRLKEEPWFADMANYMVTGELPPPSEITRAQKMKIKSEARYYFWDDLYLWKVGTDQVIRRCIPDWEQEDVLIHCHSLACGGHFGPKRTARKVLDSGFYWPSLHKDAYEFCQRCN